MKKLFYLTSIGILVGLLMVSCKNKKENSAENAQLIENDSIWVTEYEGTIPCADCPGIKTNLKLSWTKENGGDNTYTLSEEYIDRGNFTSTGKFNTEKGFEDDNDATVVILDWDKPQDEQRYYVWFSNNPKLLHVLNPQKELNKNSGMDYILELLPQE